MKVRSIRRRAKLRGFRQRLEWIRVVSITSWQPLFEDCVTYRAEPPIRVRRELLGLGVDA